MKLSWSDVMGVFLLINSCTLTITRYSSTSLLRGIPLQPLRHVATDPTDYGLKVLKYKKWPERMKRTESQRFCTRNAHNKRHFNLPSAEHDRGNRPVTRHWPTGTKNRAGPTVSRRIWWGVGVGNRTALHWNSTKPRGGESREGGGEGDGVSGDGSRDGV